MLNNWAIFLGEFFNKVYVTWKFPCQVFSLTNIRTTVLTPPGAFFCFVLFSFSLILFLNCLPQTKYTCKSWFFMFTFSVVLNLHTVFFFLFLFYFIFYFPEQLAAETVKKSNKYLGKILVRLECPFQYSNMENFLCYLIRINLLLEILYVNIFTAAFVPNCCCFYHSI